MIDFLFVFGYVDSDLALFLDFAGIGVAGSFFGVFPSFNFH